MIEQVILSGNCNWTFEAVFQHIKGIESVSGGVYNLKPYDFKFSEKDKIDAILLEFDNTVITLEQILDIFYNLHNPNINSWEEDKCFAFHHRSSIIVNKEQKPIADFKVKEITSSKKFGDSTSYGGTINTKIIIYIDDLFIPNKDNNKNFYLNKPKDPYSVNMILPKLEKIQMNFPQFYQNMNKPALKDETSV